MEFMKFKHIIVTIICLSVFFFLVSELIHMSALSTVYIFKETCPSRIVSLSVSLNSIHEAA